jgi:hypothetical protein
MKQASRSVLAFEISGHFSAEKATRDWVRGIAPESGALASLIDVNEERTSVGTVESADGMAGFCH